MNDIGEVHSAAEAAITTANSALENIEKVHAGGRNLLLETGTETSLTYWGWSTQTGIGTSEIIDDEELGEKCVKLGISSEGAGDWSYISYPKVDRTSFKPDTTYILTFWCKPSVRAGFTIMICRTTSQDNLINYIEIPAMNPNSWNKIQVAIKSRNPLPTFSDQCFYLTNMPTTLNATYTFRQQMKIEEGEYATDWEPDTLADTNEPVYFATSKTLQKLYSEEILPFRTSLSFKKQWAHENALDLASFDDITEQGWYSFYCDDAEHLNSMNAPPIAQSNNSLVLVVFKILNTVVIQLAFNEKGVTSRRRTSSGTWLSWSSV